MLDTELINEGQNQMKCFSMRDHVTFLLFDYVTPCLPDRDDVLICYYFSETKISNNKYD